MSYARRRLCAALLIVYVVNLCFILLAEDAQAASYKRGSTGSTVSQIQQKLKNWGYYSGEVDGVFGSRTEASR